MGLDPQKDVSSRATGGEEALTCKPVTASGGTLKHLTRMPVQAYVRAAECLPRCQPTCQQTCVAMTHMCVCDVQFRDAKAAARAEEDLKQKKVRGAGAA